MSSNMHCLQSWTSAVGVTEDTQAKFALGSATIETDCSPFYEEKK